MNTSKILICAVVLWTSVAARNVDRARRSLDVEAGGGNLTQRQRQEVVHSDALQHFTTPPPPRVLPSAAVAEEAAAAEGGDTPPGLASDVPSLPEEVNVQNLKNDDPPQPKYERKILDRVKEDTEQNKTTRSKTNDVPQGSVQTSSSRSEVSVSRSLYEQTSSSSMAYNYEKSAKDDGREEETSKTHSVTSTTEKFESNAEWKSYEGKKKDKSKKDIHDSTTVPTDLSGAGSVEKPHKENTISGKLKEKGKESISEALDEQRSTIRISSSNSDSVSERNDKHLANLDAILVSSPEANYEELVNQSVNAVINGNSVNSETPKQFREKYSVKREHDSVNDTEGDNSSANGNLLSEDATKDNVQLLNVKIQTTPTAYVDPVGTEKMAFSKDIKHNENQSTESTPLKLDILPSHTNTPLAIAVVKPSIAFKQQLAYKLKALEPSPSASTNVSDSAVENADKFVGKPISKLNLKKKFPEVKPEQYATPSETIPPTATAWSLASLRSPSDSTGTSRRPSEKSVSIDISGGSPTTTTQTTGTSTSKVKPFSPWSVKLQSSSNKPPTTANDGVQNDLQLKNNSQKTDNSSEESVTISTEAQTVIWTTQELDRNVSDMSQKQHAPGEVMVKDQSSNVFQETSNATLPTSEMTPILNSSVITFKTLNNSIKAELADKGNTIDIKLISGEENKKNESTKIIGNELIGDKISKTVSNKSSNEISPSFLLSESLNDIKVGAKNDSIRNEVVTTSAPATTTVIDHIEGPKTRNLSEVGELSDTANGDIHVDGNDDAKSVEDSDEDDKPKLTTTVPPLQDNFETTISPDLDEDVDGEGDSDREDEELPFVSDKHIGNRTLENNTLPINTTTKTDITITTTIQPTPSSATQGDLNIATTSVYVTSFDVIVAKENSSEVSTKTPLESDKNWYSVDSSPGISAKESSSEESFSSEINTTVVLDTTPRPETTTETSKRETTIKPAEADVSVPSMSPPTTAQAMETTVPDESDEEMLPSSCARIQIHESPERFCLGQMQLRSNIASQLVPLNVTLEQVLIMSSKLQECDKKEQSTEDELIDVDICFINKDEHPSPNIRDEFLKVYSEKARDSAFRIVDLRVMRQEEVSSGFDTVLAAIVLSVIAAICLLLLGILLVIVRKRQGGLNYPQRCTPVSLDDYSLDNISVYNSVRRKGNRRASKRSYGNPGFDDPGGPTHAINFAGLANFSSDRAALDEEFGQIPTVTVKPDELPQGVESKNRYANVIPIPETKVSLQTKEGASPMEEYINANYIKGTKGQEKLYIACQAPLQSTVEDFWKMVWQEQTKVILMLTALNENGVEKCAEYLPQLEITDCHRIFGDFQVTLKKHEVRENYIISSLHIKNLETNLWREVTHLWYSSWPAQGVPVDGSAVIAFLIEARSYARGAQGPTVVHCSPGTGRTGAVIAIDLCIRDFETLRSVDIPKTVYAIRRDRAGAVQTKDQYAFIYQVLNLYATKLTGGVLDSI